MTHGENQTADDRVTHSASYCLVCRSEALCDGVGRRLVTFSADIGQSLVEISRFLGDFGRPRALVVVVVVTAHRFIRRGSFVVSSRHYLSDSYCCVLVFGRTSAETVWTLFVADGLIPAPANVPTAEGVWALFVADGLIPAPANAPTAEPVWALLAVDGLIPPATKVPTADDGGCLRGEGCMSAADFVRWL